MRYIENCIEVYVILQYFFLRDGEKSNFPYLSTSICLLKIC